MHSQEKILGEFQKQLFGGVLEKGVLKNFKKIQTKTHVYESLFKKVAGLRALLKRGSSFGVFL